MNFSNFIYNIKLLLMYNYNYIFLNILLFNNKIDKIFEYLKKDPSDSFTGVYFIQFSYTFHKYNQSAPNQV